LSEALAPEARLRWLQALAAELPEGGNINLCLFWENEHGSVGAHAYRTEMSVHFFGAEHPVTSLAEAAELLREIFAGEVVVLTAYEGERCVYRAMARTGDVSGGLNYLQPMGRNLPEVDFVTRESWSQGLIEED